MCWTGSGGLDHMQQHTGQHVLSETFIKRYQAHTVAFHLGAAEVTIDLNRNDLAQAHLAAVEAAANDVIDEALPVRAAFVTDAELAQLPLRKAAGRRGRHSYRGSGGLRLVGLRRHSCRQHGADRADQDRGQ